MLTVAGDEIGGAAIDGRSLLDEIAREGARRMLVAANAQLLRRLKLRHEPSTGPPLSRSAALATMDSTPP